MAATWPSWLACRQGESPPPTTIWRPQGALEQIVMTPRRTRARVLLVRSDDGMVDAARRVLRRSFRDGRRWTPGGIGYPASSTVTPLPVDAHNRHATTDFSGLLNTAPHMDYRYSTTMPRVLPAACRAGSAYRLRHTYLPHACCIAHATCHYLACHAA